MGDFLRLSFLVLLSCSCCLYRLFDVLRILFYVDGSKLVDEMKADEMFLK